MNVAYSDPRSDLVVQRPFFRGSAEHKITPEVAEKRCVRVCVCGGGGGCE